MAIPLSPFQVVVDRYIKGGTVNRRIHNFVNLSEAWDCSANQLRHPGTRRVQIMVVISDNRPPQTQGG